MRLEKARFLFPKLKERDFSRSQNLYNKLMQETKTDEDFFEFISNAKAAKIQPEKRSNIIKLKPLKPFVYIASGLAAACILMALNFFYYTFLPEEHFISYPIYVSSKIEITRKGFFFGEKSLKTQRILLGRDRINAREDISYQTERGMNLYIKKDSEFSFKEEENKFIAKLNTGTYLIDFDKEYKDKMAVEFPMDNRVIVTGTRIYFDIQKERNKVYMKEGYAKLEISDMEAKDLDEKSIYAIKDNKVIEKQSLSREEEENLLDTFKSLNIEDSGSGETLPEKEIVPVKEKKEQKSALSETEKSYKKLSVIITKHGKRYTGTFRVIGKNMEVTTKDGKIIIPSEDIKSLSPYKGD